MYGVFLFGPTDCFLDALFFDENHALEWATKYSNNPEDYFIKKLSEEELLNEL